MARLKKLDVEKTAKHPTIAQLPTRENATDTPEDVVGGAQELSDRPSHSQKACLSVSKNGASKPRLDQVAYCALGISNTAIFLKRDNRSVSRLRDGHRLDAVLTFEPLHAQLRHHVPVGRSAKSMACAAQRISTARIAVFAPSRSLRAEVIPTDVIFTAGTARNRSIDAGVGSCSRSPVRLR